MARSPRKKTDHRARKRSVNDTGLTVAIVGRPNVGKSTLFNRLIGRRSALVHDRPGVTRDRREGAAQIGDLAFTAVDTAGFEDAEADTLEGRMRKQTEKAVADADVALFLVDARAGITTLDEQFADLLRRSRTPVVLVANKCEGKGQDEAFYDAYRLGLGDALAVSAEHGQGLDAIYDALRPYVPDLEAASDDEDDAAESAPSPEENFDDPERPIQLAIIGRPNTGKSTLVNRLLGEDRVLTGPEPGVTRDAIHIDWTFNGRRIRLVDTAGVRRKARITDAVEKLSVSETFNAVRLAEVVVLVLDAESPLDKQELTLARHVVDEGRALVVAVNKWDLVKDKNKTLIEIQERLAESLAQVRGVPLITFSAKTGQRVDTMMETVLKIHRVWNTHVATNALNRWLSAMTQAHPPPLSAHKQRIKLRFISQVKTRPPSFVIFSTRAVDLPEAYTRYLTNGLRDSFGLDGVPIRITLRKPKNPFDDE